MHFICTANRYQYALLKNNYRNMQKKPKYELVRLNFIFFECQQLC